MDILLIASIGTVLLLLLWWLLFQRAKSNSSKAVPQDTSAPLDHSVVSYSQLVLGDIHQSLALIERFEPPAIFQQESLPISQHHLQHWSAIFQHAPSLATNTLSTSPNMYVLRFSPDVTRGITNGSLNVMQAAEGGLRGIAVDGHGQIVSHGTLFPVSSIKLATIVTSVWQGLAFVTAQQYLPEINRRLQHIEQGINEITEHLETRDIAILLGNLNQLKSLRFLLDDPEFQESELLAGIMSLDTIDLECGQVLEAYRHHMIRYATEFGALSLGGTNLFASNRRKRCGGAISLRPAKQPPHCCISTARA